MNEKLTNWLLEEDNQQHYNNIKEELNYNKFEIQYGELEPTELIKQYEIVNNIKFPSYVRIL